MMVRGLLPSAFVTLCIATNPGLAVAQASAPHLVALPPLVLDELPPPVRAGLQLASDEARRRPHDASAVGRLGMLLHAYEQNRSAESCYRAAQQLDPGAISWTYLVAVVQAELGDHAEAATSFRRALGLDPGYLPARVRLAEALMNAGDSEASRREFEALVRDFPELALAHYGLGRLSWNGGHAAAATGHYERAVALEPQFGPAHYALALAYRNAGASDRAQAQLAVYRQLGARRPVLPDRLLDEIRAMKGTGRDLLAEGARLGAAGRLADAIALHLKAIEADPADAQAHVNLISLYGRTGQPDKAEAHYRAALTLGSSLAGAHYNYGVLQAAGGRLDAADEAFRKALTVDPFHAQAHNNLAALLVRQGRLEDAADHYRRALANDPQHPSARASLGRLLLALGRPREAVEQFRRVLGTADLHSPRAMYELATAYQAAGDLKEAVDQAQQALDRARAVGQTEVAAHIEGWLRQLKESSR